MLRSRKKDYGFNLILKNLITDDPIIFDVGAEDGSSCHRYLKLFKSPFIYSFEPRKDKYEIMLEKYKDKKNILCNNFALGSKNEVKNFNIIVDGGRSSFLKSTVDNLQDQNIIKTKVKTIDSYAEQNKIEKINLLKIDVQGFEDEVLKGAKKMLKLQKIDIIELELIIGNMYEKTLSFADIENILYPYGYKFFGITNHHALDQHSSNILQLPSLQFDIIYTKSEIYNKYAFGDNFFKKSIYRDKAQTIEEYKKDKLKLN